MSDLTEYSGLLAEIKTRIQAAQTRAVLAVNAELIRLYWQIGQLLDARQQSEGWGAGKRAAKLLMAAPWRRCS